MYLYPFSHCRIIPWLNLMNLENHITAHLIYPILYIKNVRIILGSTITLITQNKFYFPQYFSFQQWLCNFTDQLCKMLSYYITLEMLIHSES
jgi:hypothetical protein